MSAIHHAIKLSALTGLITLSFLSGCGQVEERELAPPADTGFLVSEKETAPVVRGNRTYAFEHEITLAGYDEIRYKISKEKLSEMESIYDMKLDRVNVAAGDHVKAGQILVSFSSKELDEQLQNGKQNKELAALNLDHIRRLAQLNPDRDYTEQIRILENEYNVADLYIKDIQSVYSQFNIIAEKDGIVSNMSAALSQGSLVANDELFRIVNGDGYYEMDLSSGEKTAGVRAEDFIAGDRYMARDDMSRTEYEFEVIAPPDGREAESNMVFFRPVSGTDEFLGQSLEIIGTPVTINDICCVNRKTIIDTDDGSYVFVKKDDGSYKAVKVTLGDIIENDVVIKEGLDGGENVLIP